MLHVLSMLITKPWTVAGGSRSFWTDLYVTSPVETLSSRWLVSPAQVPLTTDQNGRNPIICRAWVVSVGGRAGPGRALVGCSSPDGWWWRSATVWMRQHGAGACPMCPACCYCCCCCCCWCWYMYRNSLCLSVWLMSSTSQSQPAALHASCLELQISSRFQQL